MNEMFHNLGIMKAPEYLYRLFDVLPKQTFQMKILQVQVHIQQ